MWPSIRWTLTEIKSAFPFARRVVTTCTLVGYSACGGGAEPPTTSVPTVPAPTPTLVILPSAIAIPGGTSSPFVSRSARLSVQGQADSTQFMWRSSDTTIATINSSGLVHAGSPGVARITATRGTDFGQATVTVTPFVDTAIVVIAHHGYQGIYPENTIEAIGGSLSSGMDGIEIDIQWTKDSVAVLMHDETVNRTTNGTGFVADLTLAQIGQLNACAKFGHGFTTCKVPTLVQAIQAVGSKVPVLLDLKDSLQSWQRDQILAYVHQYALHDVTALISDNSGDLMGIRALDATIALGLGRTGLPALGDVRVLGNASAYVTADSLVQMAGLSAYVAQMHSAGLALVASGVTSQAQAITLLKAGNIYLLSDVPLSKAQIHP
jgi:glycerophosphoryl diester phosphodiesterase